MPLLRIQNEAQSSTRVSNWILLAWGMKLLLHNFLSRLAMKMIWGQNFSRWLHHAQRPWLVKYHPIQSLWLISTLLSIAPNKNLLNKSNCLNDEVNASVRFDNRLTTEVNNVSWSIAETHAFTWSIIEQSPSLGWFLFWKIEILPHRRISFSVSFF